MAGALTYLDNNATTPVRPEVIGMMTGVLNACGNPSSIHGPGRAARSRLECARAQIAALAGARASEVVFTSGGTEANNLALRGAPVARVLASAIEHDSVLKSAPSGAPIPVLPCGVTDLSALEAMLEESRDPALVSIMLANNETGILQPVAEAARLAHAHGALLHCDAVQAAGKIPLHMPALGADLLSLSAHKFGGPQGAGALIVRDGVRLASQMRGGGQERGLRGGTENAAAITGFGHAAQMALETLDELPDRLYGLRARLEAGVAEITPQAVFFGQDRPRLPNTSCFSLPGVRASTLVMNLDLMGVAVSAGAACSSGKVTPSPVLRAMGVGEALADSAIRVSLGWANSPEDVEAFLAAWRAICARLTLPMAS